MRGVRSSLLASALTAALVLAALPAMASQHGDGPAIVVHLSHYTDDLHAVSMALALAANLQRGGARTTLFLDLEGVRLADERGNPDLRWGGGRPIMQRLDVFVKAGGSVLLCAHCANAAGISANDVRKGAAIASDSQVRDLFLEADKVIDY